MSSAIYVVDTSSWIRLSREHLIEPNSIVWHRMDALIREKRIVSPLAVYNEVLARNDALRVWLGYHEKAFVEAGTETLRIVAEINREHPGLVDHNKKRDDADPYLIAVARMSKAKLVSNNPLVVTEESDNSRKTTKIPQVALKYGIQCIDAGKMLKREGLQ